MKRHPKLWRGVKWTLGSLIALPVGLVVLVLTALAVPYTSKPIVSFALDKTNESLEGMRIVVDDVTRLDLWGIDVHGARVYDEKQREMVYVQRASVRLKPFGLFGGTLHLTDVGVRGVRVHLYPSDVEQEEKPEEPSQPSSFQIVADKLRVSDATLDMDLSGKALHAVVLFLQASGAYGPRTWAALQKADIFAELDRERALTLRATRATWDEKKGGEALLQGDLLDGHFTISARVPPVDKMEPWPLERARISLSGVTNEGLTRVGYGELVQLRAPVTLDLNADKRGPDLVGKLLLGLGSDQLVVDARASHDKYFADVKLTPVQLSSIAGILPVLKVGFDMHAELEHARKPMRGQLEWREVQMDERAVPDGALNVELPLPVIKLTRLAFVGFERALRVSGQYNLDSGAAQASIDTSELDLAALGGLFPGGTRGTLNGGLNARVQGQALSGRSELSVRYLRVGTTAIDALSLGLDLSGSPTEPLGNLHLEAKQLMIDKTSLLRVDVHGELGLRELKADLSVEGVDRYVSLELAGVRNADGTIKLDAHGKGRVADKEVGLTVEELKVGQAAYSVRQFTAFSGSERITASGSYDAQQRLDLALSIVNLDLAPFARLGLKNDLSGRLDLSARAGGTVERPYLSSQFAVYGLHSERTPRAPKVDVRSAVLLDLAHHKAELTLNVHSADKRVTVNVAGKAALAKRARDLTTAFKEAVVDLSLKAHTDVPFLEQFAPEGLPALEGTLDASLAAKGDLDAAALDFELLGHFAPRAEVARGLRDRLELRVKLAEQALTAGVAASDAAGKMLDVKSAVELPQGGPRALMEMRKELMHAPAKLELLLKERRLDELTGTWAVLAKQYKASVPVRIAANGAADSDGKGISGKLVLRAHAWGKGLDPNCEQGAEADVTVDATLIEDKAQVIVKASPSGGGEAEINANTVITANALLDGKALLWGPLNVRAQGDKLDLHTFPALCMLPPSRTQFVLSADDVGKGPTKANLTLNVEDLPAGNEGKMGIALVASTSADAAQAKGKIRLNGKDRGALSAHVPLTYANSQVPSVPMDKPIHASLRLPKFPLAALTSFTSAVGRAGGEVEIHLGVEGTLSTLEPTGYVELHDAAFSLASLAQPFSNIDGRLELERNKLTIRKLVARDRDGKLQVNGYAKYARERGGEAEVHMAADRFPLRQQGSIIGELSTRAVMKGKVGNDNLMHLLLAIEEGRIWLTGEGGRDVQDLDEHPDIRFDNEKALLESMEDTPAEGSLTLAELKIRTDRELWVQHKDFSVQVGVELDLHMREEGVSLEGEARLVRGDLQLLGKPFRLNKGAVRFTGAVPPDPELDIKATHRTRQGQTLNVQVAGRGSAPVITFSGAASNAGEAALLLSGIGNPNAESGAKRDAASFAAGLTAGLLAVSARRKFGDWVPMLAIENNAAGRPSGARAGVDASALIPEFMRGFARGMYVEGVVGTRSDTAQSRGVGVGVRVEVALPQDFVTSMGYGPGTVWSTDVYWSP